MPAVGHPPNISMLPILVNRYADTVPALNATLRGKIIRHAAVCIHRIILLLYFILPRMSNFKKINRNFPAETPVKNYKSVYFSVKRNIGILFRFTVGVCFNGIIITRSPRSSAAVLKRGFHFSVFRINDYSSGLSLTDRG